MSRKFRWTLEATFPFGNIEPTYVKVDSRPNIDIEEVETSHLSPKTWIPGKSSWQDITTTFYDCPSDASASLWKVLAATYELCDRPADSSISFPEDKMGELKLRLWCPQYIYAKPTPEEIEANKKRNEELAAQGKRPAMGIGMLGTISGSSLEELEEWTLKNAWPIKINFGELDYSSSGQFDAVITWRYSEVLYKNCWKPLETK